jgi:dimethylamine monooxygenase subunit A
MKAQYIEGVSSLRPLYFPVKAEPLRMQPGLLRFGTDFGNGEADQRFFPGDETAALYLAAKARVLAAYPERERRCVESEQEGACLAAAEAWFSETLVAEGQASASRAVGEGLGRELAEDFAVLHVNDARVDRVLWLSACFPSGWRPEHVIGRSFSQIHRVIPAIDRVLRGSRGLVEAMVTRGPYVRFVWTISADDELDHHPEQGKRRPWTNDTMQGFLRVERQTTIPLPVVRGSIFLIRTYLYRFDELTRDRRDVLAQALAQMPLAVAKYKGLEGALLRAQQLLRASA